MLSLNIMPVCAIDNSSTTETPKVKRSLFAKKDKVKNNQYKFDYVNYEWWNTFGDEFLSAYIKRAIENNHDLKASTLMTQEYFQAMRMQFSQELPQIGGGFGTGYNKMPGVTNAEWNFAVPVFASYELDLFLKNRDKTRSAKKNYEASLQDERAAHIAIVSAVGTTYLNLVRLDKTIKLQQNIVDIRSKLYELEKLRYDEGISSSMDVVNSEKSLITAQNMLIDAQKIHYKLLNQFAVLIGESPENAAGILRKDFDSLNCTQTIPAEISTEVITSRPDYVKAELQVQKAGLDVRVAKKDFLPSLDLGGLALFNNANFGSLFTTKGMLAGLGGGIGMSLFTGGRKIANLRLKKATYQRILENYYQTNLRSIQEVNDALFVLKSDDERYNQLVKQYELESENYALHEIRYEEGVISEFDLLRYKEGLLTLENQLDAYKTDRLTSFIGLYKAVGSKL